MNTLAFGLGYLLVGLDVVFHGPPHGTEQVLPLLGALERFFLVQLGLSEDDLLALQELWTDVAPFITEPWVLQYREHFLQAIKKSTPVYKTVWMVQMSALASFHQLMLGDIPFAPQYHRVQHFGRYVGIQASEQQPILQQGLLWAYQLWELCQAFRQMGTSP